MANQVERICAQCRATQHIDARYCGTCGAPLERLVPVGTRQWLPARVRQQLHHPLVRGVAVGATAVAVELAVALVRRILTEHIRGQSGLQLPVQRSTSSAPSATAPRHTVVTARRRFWQKTDRRGNVQVDEHITWTRSEH